MMTAARTAACTSLISALCDACSLTLARGASKTSKPCRRVAPRAQKQGWFHRITSSEISQGYSSPIVSSLGCLFTAMA